MRFFSIVLSMKHEFASSTKHTEQSLATRLSVRHRETRREDIT